MTGIVPRIFVRLFVLAVLVYETASPVLACAICFSAVSVTTGQKLDAADEIVLAMPLSDGERFRVVKVIKGDAGVGTTVEETVSLADSVDLQSGKLLLLVRNELSGRWTSLGAIGSGHADWLRQLVKTKDGRSMGLPVAWPLAGRGQAVPDSTNWPKRIILVEQLLESEDPLAAEIAYGEFSRAPYSAMRRLKPVLDPDRIRSWIDDPELATRRDGYLLLLGIAGGADDATVLEERLAAAWASRDATNVAALLTADLELRGPARVAWIEENYLVDRDRTLPEIRAALLALSVHGKAGGRISRQRIVDAYRLFIRERKPMAGFVAMDLAAWQAWDAVPDYIDVLEVNAVKDPAGEFAIVAYLQESQTPEARAALAAFTRPSK
jgi:hypothetical protein